MDFQRNTVAIVGYSLKLLLNCTGKYDTIGQSLIYAGTICVRWYVIGDRKKWFKTILFIQEKWQRGTARAQYKDLHR